MSGTPTFEWGERSGAEVYRDKDVDHRVVLSIGGDEQGKPYEYLRFTEAEWARFKDWIATR